MRISAALSASLAWLFLAQLAAAQSPEGAAAAAATPSASAPAAPAPAAPAPAASTPPAPALDIVPTEPDQPLLQPIPSARDTLGGHFVIGAGAGAKWPFGSHSGALGAGLGLNLDLGYGISRNVVLGAWGEFDSYSTVSGCGDCSGRSFAGGPLVRYHIVQGTRFDPWGELAVGVRSTTVDIRGESKNHVGPDFLKLTLGGDWYPTANFGIGPYVTFDIGTYGSSSHSGLGTGLRLVLDLPGK
ncbi:MAG: hypothetical protein ABW061_08205 [Polyangiaceae bacterium]